MIDVRELRIGNHILVNGVRAKVIDIDKIVLNWNESPYRIFVEGISPETGELTQVGILEDSDGIQPIPVTKELLIEMGFEEDNDLHFDYVKRFENKLSLFITLHDDGCLRIEAWDDVIHRGNMICQYLHEIQNFVFSTCKIELV